MRFNILILITILKITKIFMVSSFIKRPFRINNNSSNKVVNFNKKHKRWGLRLMDKIRNNKEVRWPAIIEIPVEAEIKWDEGEIPWEISENDNSTTSSKLPNSEQWQLDSNNIAFLFI